MMISKQESSLNMLTSSCGINREGKIDCQLKSKEDWRNNLNQAQRKFDDLQREMEQHRRLLDKLKKSKPASRHRDTSRTHIPCTCLHPNSFKTRTDRTYKEIKEKRKREQEEKEKIKQRKLQRKTLFQRSCKRDGMSCFTVDNSTWLVPPRWDGDPQCHCTSSSNSSYSCIRKIGHGNGESSENDPYYAGFLRPEYKKGTFEFRTFLQPLNIKNRIYGKNHKLSFNQKMNTSLKLFFSYSKVTTKLIFINLE